MFETGGVESRNPIFSESPEMVELTNRRSRGKEMKVKPGRMVPHFLSESRDQGNGLDAAHTAREESAAGQADFLAKLAVSAPVRAVTWEPAAVQEGKTTDGAIDDL